MAGAVFADIVRAVKHYTAADLPDEGWTTVSESLFIGPSPFGAVNTDNVERAIRLIRDGLTVNVPDSQMAVEVLVRLGVGKSQALRQVGWANGQDDV